MRLKGVPMDPHESQSPSARIATSAVQVLHECTGRGPMKAKTTINGSLVTILLADTLTTGERTLLEHGHSDDNDRLMNQEWRLPPDRSHSHVR